MASARPTSLWPLGVLVCLSALHAFAYKGLQDFGVFYRAGARFLEGSELYRLSDGIECFKYAPPVTLFFAPFSVLPFRTAAFIWMAVTAAALMGTFWMLWNGLSPQAPPPTVTFSLPIRAPGTSQNTRWVSRVGARFARSGGDAGWPVIVLLLISPFLRYLLALGQCDAVLLFALVLSERWAVRRPFVSGLLVAGAVLFKLPFLILLPLILFYREWRRSAGLGAGLAMGIAVPVIRMGLHGAKEQFSAWRELLAQTTPPMLCHFDNQSVFGMACRFVASPDQTWAFRAAVLGASAVAITGATWAVWQTYQRDTTRARPLANALALYLSALLSPLGWRSNLVALLPLFYLAQSCWPNLSRLQKMMLGISPLANVFVGLVSYDLLGRTAFHWLVENRLIGLLAVTSAAACASVWISNGRTQDRSPAANA